MKRQMQLVLMGACAITLLQSCGQKGPLYMPDQATEIVTRPTQTPPAESAPTDSSGPAPEATPPDPDKDKKEHGANAPR